MQKKVLFLVFGVLLVFILFLLIFLLNSSNIKNSSYNNYPSNPKDKNSAYGSKNNSWADKLSSYQKKDYLFPVTELFLTMKFAKKKRTVSKERENYYNLVIPDLNNYSLFCILQILDRKKVPYIIENGYENSKIFIKADKIDRLKDISDELIKYDISSRVVSSE
jgi:hypothetical protein